MPRLVILSLSVIILLTLAPAAPADRSGIGPFSRAVINGDYATVSRMLRANPSLARTRDFGPGQRHMRMTPLHWAATTRRARMARLLCSFGADPNARDHYGLTPYRLALMASKLETMRVLAKAGGKM